MVPKRLEGIGDKIPEESREARVIVDLGEFDATHGWALEWGDVVVRNRFFKMDED